MNKQIKELMVQAGTDSSGKWMSVDHASKFAELIILECIASCKIIADVAESTNTGEMARKTKETAISCADLIKKQFEFED